MIDRHAHVAAAPRGTFGARESLAGLAVLASIAGAFAVAAVAMLASGSAEPVILMLLGILAVFGAFFLLLGAPIYRLLGGSGRVLELALVYSTTFFSGAVAVWLLNTLISIVRGTGNMRLSSAILVAGGLLQVALGGSLALGLGPMPRLGLAGVALGQIGSAVAGVAFLLWHLTRGGARLRLGLAGVAPDRALVVDILKVGAVACLSPVQSILVVLIVARLVAGYGTAELAGFGIGVRLELLLIPIAFAFGVACVPMVGMAIGAGDVARARRVAWTGACLSGALIGAVGLVFSTWPALWAGLFTSDAAVVAATADYLGIAGFGFGAYGLGLCLYFASQGSGKILGPVLAGTVRLAVAAAGGWWIVTTEQGFRALAMLVAFAMLAYGAAAVLAVLMTTWKPGGGR